MSRLLTPDEASRGIYIDFEGRTDQAPVLLGVFAADDAVAGASEQIVLEPRFAPAAAAKSLRVATIESIIGELVERAEAEDRVLIGWSRHEVEVVERDCTVDLARRFADRYVDAKAIAKVAQRRSGLALPPARGREKGHALARYMKLLGQDVPPSYGSGRTGNTIRILDDGFARRSDWAALTSRRKQRWTCLLGHNRSDCEGTRAVALWATGVTHTDAPAAAA